MSASRAPRSLSLVLCLALISALAPASAGATTTLPIPGSIAAVGDSITQAASSGGSLGADYPENSWSTGANSTVYSHYLRLLELSPSVTRHNESVSGARMAALDAQMANVAALKPDYLTVLIGGNDLCTDTIDDMTPVGDFEKQFETAMLTLTSGSPDTAVYVVGIPDVHQLWELFRNNFFARAVWSAGNICQSLLENPTSNQQADKDRRAAFQRQNVAYNTALETVCRQFAQCHYDSTNAVFHSQIERADVAGDYFHPSVAGQAKLADVSWDVGYSWTADTDPEPGNASPAAGFTHECSGLSCSFTDTSTDSDGSVVAWSWNFGDGNTSTPAGTSTAQDPSYTFAGAGTYTVTLTVTDDGGATGSTTQSVTASDPTAGISLDVNAYKVRGSKMADLSWTGAATTSVVIYRDGDEIATTVNDGAYTDAIGGRGGGSHTYQVCETGESPVCSDVVSVSY